MFDFIKPYLHILEAIAIVALLSFLTYMWHAHNASQQAIGAVGVKQDDAEALKQRLAEVALENGRLKAKADVAEHSHDQELEDLRAYRFDHPVTPVWVSNTGTSHCINRMSETTGTIGQSEGASTAAESIQQLPPGDTGSSAINISGMLDALAARADQVSSSLREWQSR